MVQWADGGLSLIPPGGEQQQQPARQLSEHLKRSALGPTIGPEPVINTREIF